MNASMSLTNVTLELASPRQISKIVILPIDNLYCHYQAVVSDGSES